MEKFEENLFRGRKGLVCFSFGFRLRLLFAFVLFLTALAKSALNNYESDVSFKKKKRFIKEKPSSTERHVFVHAAVATDNWECSKIGRNILHQGGSAVDSILASMLCLSVVHPQSSGIGGGGVMLVYQRNTGFSEVIDFREVAPSLATKNMFHGNINKSLLGGLAVAIPGELKGIEAAWKKYGKLPWKKLFEPAINLAEKGFNVSKAFALESIRAREFLVRKDNGLREAFTCDGRLLKVGDIMNRTAYARTLRIIANAGNADPVYGGSLGRQMVKDINTHGGQFVIDDLRNYQVRFREPIKVSFGKGKLLTTPAPSSGPLLALVMNMLKGYNFTQSDLGENTTLTWHRFIETFQMAYAKRHKLGDPDYVRSVEKATKEMLDQKFADRLRERISEKKTFPASYYDGDDFDVPVKAGTTHLVVLAENGDSVSVTSTVNHGFGVKLRSRNLGVVYNNQMDDFSSPGVVNYFGLKPAPVNFIQPGKRPQSSSSPVIILDRHGDVDVVIGASGGTFITTALAETLANYFWFNKDINDAISLPRLHHQLYPQLIVAETHFPATLLHKLEKYGYKLCYLMSSKLLEIYAHSATSAHFYPIPSCEARKAEYALSMSQLIPKLGIY